MIPVEQLEALVRFLSPEEITPTAKRMLLAVCDQHRDSSRTLAADVAAGLHDQPHP